MHIKNKGNPSPYANLVVNSFIFKLNIKEGLVGSNSLPYMPCNEISSIKFIVVAQNLQSSFRCFCPLWFHK